MMKHREMGDVVVVNLRGRIDITSNAELADALKRLVAKNLDKNFVIDLSEVEYMSSSGLGVMVTIKRDLAIKNKMLHLAGIQQPVKKVFQVSGLVEHFALFDDEQAAIAAFDELG